MIFPYVSENPKMASSTIISPSNVKDYSRLAGKLRLGLCCINSELQKQKGIFCSRTMIKKNFTLTLAQERALQNIADIIPILKWNLEHRIYCFRLTSELFPRYTDPDITSYNKEFAREALLNAGNYAKSHHQRILCHPSQFNVVGTPNPETFINTCRQLTHEAEILDMMGIDNNGILIVHMGGVYEDKPATIQRWIQQFQALPSNVKARLVIENCERNCSVLDALQIAEGCGIPMVFDLFHHACYAHLHPKEISIDIPSIFSRILKTWGTRVPIMHISEQAVDWTKVNVSSGWVNKEQPRIGAHSEYISEIPIWFLDLLLEHDASVDLEVEAKAKEAAILRLYELYPQIFPKPVPNLSDITNSLQSLELTGTTPKHRTIKLNIVN
jgi:UV DNA damage endonuclease